MSMGTASLLGSRQSVATLSLTATLDVPDEFNLNSAGSIALTAGGTGEDITLTSAAGRAVISLNAAGIPTAIANTALHIVGPDAAGSGFLIDTFGSNANFSGRRANGTFASPTTITANQNMLTMAGYGYDGTSYSSVQALIGLRAGESWGASAHGSYIIFQTTPIGSTTMAEAGRFEESGKLTLTATTTSRASLNVPHGTAPSSPVNGDIWTTTSGLLVRINGVTKTVTLT